MIFRFLLLAILSFPVFADKIEATNADRELLSATSTTTGVPVQVDYLYKTYYAKITCTGTCTGTVLIYGNNKRSTTNAELITTLILNGTNEDIDSLPGDTSNWPWIFADLTSLSSNGDEVVTVGVLN